MRKLSLLWLLLGVLTSLMTTTKAITPLDHSGIREITHTSLKRSKTHGHAEENAEGVGAGEERGGIPLNVNTFVSKIRRSIGKIKGWFQKAQNKKFLVKMEEMYISGMTPEKLAKRYGSKKMELQDEFSQYYKWRSSWKLQKSYPRPKNLEPAKNSDDTLRGAIEAAHPYSS